MKIERILSLTMLVLVGMSLQSQPDKSEAAKADTSQKPDAAIVVADSSSALDEKQILEKKFAEEIKKTESATVRIEKKVESIPTIIDKALLKMKWSNRLKPVVERLDPIQPSVVLPEIVLDSTIIRD